MGFLDNSGDIILDAVLTDAGRKRLAKGDGRFKIVKFALGDDEIDYSNYRNNNHAEGAHSSGSAYYDLEILQTPILEAMTNARTSLKSHLLTELNNRKLYRGALRLNTKEETSALSDATASFHIPVSKTSRDAFSKLKGSMDGYSPKDSKSFIQIDQGLDTGFQVPADSLMDAEDRETQYTIRMDNRLGEITDEKGRTIPKSFVDDDNIATYHVTLASADTVVTSNNNTEQSPGTEVIEGPRGTKLKFKVKSALNLERSSYLFNKIGKTTTLIDKDGTDTSVKVIDSTVTVEGTTTGTKIDVPLRYVKTAAE